MSRIPVLAGNWKMHKTPAQARELAAGLVACLADVEGREIVVAPAFPSLGAVAMVLAGSGIMLGAQNLHQEESGAFTGEVSAEMLLGCGCTHVIVGHSERRQLMGESNTLINRKIRKALSRNLIPILCVGETLEEREAGQAEAVVRVQIEEGLKDLTRQDAARMMLAYEPVWAIGTGRTATPEQAQEMHRFARGLLEGLFGSDVAEGLRILYGGSVKPDNIDALMAQPDLDGALVGGASLKAADFERIVKFQ